MTTAHSGRFSRVAVVVNDLRSYGAQNVAVVLAGALHAMGHTVTVITLERRAADEWPLPDGVALVRLDRRGRGPASYLMMARALRSAARAAGVDLILSHMTFSNLVVLLGRPKGIPVIATEHNVLTRNLTVERSPRAISALVRWLLPRATAVVGVSDDVVRDLVDNHCVPAGSVHRIYNPLPRSGTVPPASELHPWLADGSPWKRLVLVGALRRAKGHGVALEAMRLLLEEPPFLFRLVCVGDGPMRAELEQAVVDAALHDRVVFVGHRPDPRAWMAAADVVLVPSLWEGFGLVAVEAASVGTPVIAADTDGIRELVPAYVRGRRFTVGSATSLAAALREVHELECFDGPDLPLSDFEPRRVARRYLELVGRDAGREDSGQNFGLSVGPGDT